MQLVERRLGQQPQPPPDGRLRDPTERDLDLEHLALQTLAWLCVSATERHADVGSALLEAAPRVPARDERLERLHVLDVDARGTSGDKELLGRSAEVRVRGELGHLRGELIDRFTGQRDRARRKFAPAAGEPNPGLQDLRKQPNHRVRGQHLARHPVEHEQLCERRAPAQRVVPEIAGGEVDRELHDPGLVAVRGDARALRRGQELSMQRFTSRLRHLLPLLRQDHARGLVRAQQGQRAPRPVIIADGRIPGHVGLSDRLADQTGRDARE